MKLLAYSLADQKIQPLEIQGLLFCIKNYLKHKLSQIINRDSVVVEVKVMRGEEVEARFHISVHDNQYGRKYEGLLGIEHYFARVRETIEKNDRQKLS